MPAGPSSYGDSELANADAGVTGESTEMSKTQREKERKRRAKASVVVEHVDIIKDEFWERRPWLLSDKPG